MELNDFRSLIYSESTSARGCSPVRGIYSKDPFMNYIQPSLMPFIRAKDNSRALLIANDSISVSILFDIC
jgi:hypothetical protein